MLYFQKVKLLVIQYYRT